MCNHNLLVSIYLMLLKFHTKLTSSDCQAIGRTCWVCLIFWDHLLNQNRRVLAQFSACSQSRISYPKIVYLATTPNRAKSQEWCIDKGKKGIIEFFGKAEERTSFIEVSLVVRGNILEKSAGLWYRCSLNSKILVLTNCSHNLVLVLNPEFLIQK